MTGMEIFLGVGIGIALIVGAVVLSFLPWRLPWPGRHNIRGSGDYSDGTARSRPSGDSDFGGGGGDGD